MSPQPGGNPIMQTSNPTLISSPCKVGGQDFEQEQLFRLDGRPFEIIATVCDPCGEARRQDPGAEITERKAAFRATLPKAFRDTDRTRIPAVLLQPVEDYCYGVQGLAMVGKSGSCKTRAMFLLLERLAASGKSCEWITSTDLAYFSADQFSDDPQGRHVAKDKLRRLRRAPVTFIDDVGKGKLTDRAEAELFDILDCRSREGLPTMWTSNSGGQDLLNMMSRDRGDALLRRMGKEFSKIIRV